MFWLLLTALLGWALAALAIGLILRIRSADRQARAPQRGLFTERQLAIEQARYRGDVPAEWPTQEIPRITE